VDIRTILATTVHGSTRWKRFLSQYVVQLRVFYEGSGFADQAVFALSRNMVSVPLLCDGHVRNAVTEIQQKNAMHKSQLGSYFRLNSALQDAENGLDPGRVLGPDMAVRILARKQLCHMVCPP
jgi:hypothetical protein